MFRTGGPRRPPAPLGPGARALGQITGGTRPPVIGWWRPGGPGLRRKRPWIRPYPCLKMLFVSSFESKTLDCGGNAPGAPEAVQYTHTSLITTGKKAGILRRGWVEDSRG